MKMATIAMMASGVIIKPILVGESCGKFLASVGVVSVLHDDFFRNSYFGTSQLSLTVCLMESIRRRLARQTERERALERMGTGKSGQIRLEARPRKPTAEMESWGVE
jgi:hypothetical protein